MKFTYTTIIHQFRDELGISNNEYTLLDTINKLSTNPKSKISGWCYARQTKLAETIGISRRAIIKMISKLESKGLLIKSTTVTTDDKAKDKFKLTIYRTSEKWYNVVVLGCEQSTLGGVNKVHLGVRTKYTQGCEQSTHIDNNTNNNKNIDNIVDSDKSTSFNSFYDLFNRKVGKKAAIKAWNSLTKTEKKKTIESIPLYNEYLALTEYDKCHPSTYLNQKRFEDDFKSLISQERAKSGNNTHQVDLAALRAKLMDLRSKHSDVWTKEYDTNIKDNGILKGYRYIERKHPEWIS